MPSPIEKLRTAGDLAKGIGVLRRRGMFNPLRPDEALKSTVDALKYGPTAGVIMHGVRRHGSAPAIVDEKGSVSFDQLDQQSNALGRGLQAAGVKQGDVIAVLARDHRGLVLTMLAAGKIGARLVLMNTGFAKPQFADVTKRENVKAVLHDSEFVDLLSAIPTEIPRVITWVDPQHELPADTKTIEDLSAGQSTERIAPPAKPGGMVILTSGTTGTPKGAPREKVSPLQSAQFLDRVPLPQNETMFMAAPIFHGTGLSQFLLGLSLGNKIVFQRRFNPESTLKGIHEHKATSLVVVPTMLQRMIDLDPATLAKYDTSSLKIIFAAGSSLSPDLCKRTTEIFGDVLYNLYGSTEVAVATVATPQDLKLAPGTVGKPPVGCRVQLYDADRNKVNTPHTIGTIFVSSGLSFAGYTDGRNKEIVEGMLSSGDVGHFDENGLWFVDGRDDDMIVSGGENVFPLEVENLLADRADVHEAAVVGVGDRDFGKRLRAFIVPSPDASRDAQEIKDYIKDNLARYKVPREVVFLDELPRNATGKLLRKVLVDMDIDAN